MKKTIIPLIIIFTLLIPMQASAAPATGTSVTVPGGPVFWVEKVVPDESVTIRVTDYPGDEKFYVEMTSLYNQSMGWINVGKLDGTYGVRFAATFSIPARLKGERNLAIRLQNKRTTAAAYTGFTNDSHFTGLGTSASNSTSPDSGGGTSVSVSGGPNFWIHDVVRDKTVTIGVSGYPGNEKFKVFIRNIDAPYVEWVHVGTLTGDYGVNFKATFDIPSRFRGVLNLSIRLQNNITNASAYSSFTNTEFWTGLGTSGPIGGTGTGSGGVPYGVPYTRVLNVVEDSEVTIQVFRFPVDKQFDVRMGLLGTRGIGGILIGVQDSGEGGSFIVTYPIPAALHGEDAIAIRLESPSSGYYVYDWFYNEDGDGGSTGSTGSTGTTGYTGPTLPAGTYPTFAIQSVTAGSKVTITGANFTANDSYVVLMGSMGTKGVGGINAGSVTTNSSGQLTNTTFSIPAALAGSSPIAIRLESTKSPYYAYNFFYNVTYP